MEVYAMNMNGKKLFKSVVLALSVSAMSIGAAQAADPVVAGADLLVARPLGLAATAVGTGISSARYRLHMWQASMKKRRQR